MRVKVRSDYQRVPVGTQSDLVEALDRMAGGETIDIRGKLNAQIEQALPDRLRIKDVEQDTPDVA